MTNLDGNMDDVFYFSLKNSKKRLSLSLFANPYANMTEREYGRI